MALNKWGGLNKWGEENTTINKLKVGDLDVEDVKLCADGDLVDVIIQVNGETVWNNNPVT